MKKIILLNLILFFTFAFSTAIIAQKQTESKSLLHPPPDPIFSVSGVCLGDTTYFINKTLGATIRWYITTSNGDTIYTSNSETAAYYFKDRGTYKICLTADNGHPASKFRTILVDSITKADFSFRYCYNEFDNLSTCSDQFVWILPDNSITTDEFPKFKFVSPGTYSVKLVAKKGNKSDTLIKVITIQKDSLNAPDATFTFKKVGGSSSVLEFTATDSMADSYIWYFGDNGYDDTTGYKITHHFDIDAYSPPVRLFVVNGCGSAIYSVDPFATTAIKKVGSLDLNALIYPNPASTEMTVSIENLPINESVIIKLIDSNGRLLQENRATSTPSVYQLKYNLENLSKGIYLVQILVNDQMLNRKIVVP
jgi:PKD repeat protein